MCSSASDSENVAVDELLKGIGLDSSLIDPSSRVALNEILLSFSDDDDLEVVIERSNASSEQPNLYNRDNPHDEPHRAGGTPGISSESTASNVFQQGSANNFSVEQLILNQMQQQTLMLIHLHEKMERLTETVERLAVGKDYSQQLQRQILSPFEQVQPPLPGYQPGRNTFIPPPPIPMIPPHERQGQQPLQQNQNQAQRRLLFFEFFTQLVQFIQRIPSIIRDSKAGKIARLFVALLQRHVRRFDVGLAIKVLFMIAILMSRIQRRNPHNERKSIFSGLSFATRFSIVATLVITGFLFQNGFFTFLYSFFVKENYVGRIMEGEDLEVERVIEEEVARRERPAANIDNNDNARGQPGALPGNDPVGADAQQAAPLFNWRHTLLGGGIAPRFENHDNQAVRPFAFVLRLVHDIVLVFGSFFLSILPMWRPVAVQRQQQQVDEAQPQPPPEPIPQGNGNGDEIPHVQPPIDPAEADED